MDDNNIKCYVTADGKVPDEQIDTSRNEKRRDLIRNRVKYTSDLNKLFIWSIISTAVSRISDSESIFLTIIGSIVSIACSFMMIKIFMHLGEEVEDYKSAAKCHIAAIIVSVVALIVGIISAVTYSFDGVGGMIIILIAGLVVGLFAEYKEFCGHSEFLRGIDDEFSEKWDNLWHRYIYAYVGLIIGLVFALIIPILGLIVVLVASIVLLVASIYKFIYLKKMEILIIKLDQECIEELLLEENDGIENEDINNSETIEE